MTQPANIVPTDRTSQFKNWVRQIWIDNCEERLTYGEDPATMKEYWNKYKYWLKREYRHQHKATL